MSIILSGSARVGASSPAGKVALADSLNPPVLSRDELLRTLHWTRPNGTPFFSVGEPRRVTARRSEWIADAVRGSGDAELSQIWKAATERKGKPASAFKGLPMPAPSFHSEALQTTVLRTDWSPGAPQLAIDWAQPEMSLELIVGRDVVLTGSVPLRVTINGQVRTTTEPWREVCRIMDNEAELLELETSLGGGVLLQRTFVLLRRDGLLWIADGVLGADRGDLQCELTLPLADEADVEPAAETRDVQVAVRRRSVAILPPALPEWRVEQTAGELSQTETGVTLRQSARDAVALLVPLCLVVDPRRARREVTWRRLTVGENLQVQPADRAVGYRLQAGREQWLVYRSLTPRANRTVLGVNLQTNFLFARLKRNGEAETLIEIED